MKYLAESSDGKEEYYDNKNYLKLYQGEGGFFRNFILKNSIDRNSASLRNKRSNYFNRN